LSATLGRPAPELAPDAIAALALHPWPGDLAELDAVLVRTLLDCGDLVGGADLRWASGSQDLGPAAAAPLQPASSATTEVDDVAPAADVPVEPTPTPAAVASGRSAPLEALAVELAHQLKNPLVTIRTFVASVDSLCDEPHELARFRGLTDEAVSRMDEILDGLLSFSRLGATALDRFDALLELRDALRAAWPALSAKQVTLDAPDGASLVAATDREHLRFAFATLARHVAETIEPRGTLAIAVEPGATLRFSYRESGAITHLRGVARAGEDSLPLALLLVRGALGRVGGDVKIALDGTDVSIWLRLSPP
jgi:signal transduction histidine kinase